jgi:hypothetical protein
MKELAETADRVLPCDEDDGPGGRGRGGGRGGGAGGRGGRPKKEKTLKEALHESWNGLVGGGWCSAWVALRPLHAACCDQKRQGPSEDPTLTHPKPHPNPNPQSPQDYLGRLQEFAKMQAGSEASPAAARAGEPEFRPVFRGGGLTPAKQQLAALGMAAARDPVGGDDEEQEPKRRRAARAGRAGSAEPDMSFLDSPEWVPKVSAAQRKRRMTTVAPSAAATASSPPAAALQARLARTRRATMAPGALSRIPTAELSTPGRSAEAPAAVGGNAAGAAAAPSSAPRSQERPAWNAVGAATAAAGGAGARAGGAAAASGGGASAVAERSDRAAVARLQAQLESRSEEVAALQLQLKDAEVGGYRGRLTLNHKATRPLDCCAAIRKLLHAPHLFITLPLDLSPLLPNNRASPSRPRGTSRRATSRRRRRCARGRRWSAASRRWSARGRQPRSG